MSGATDRLPRLLTLVPWLLANPDTPIEQAAAEFGVTAEQLRADLDLIWMCGLPGHGPGDLIDVWITRDRVTLSNADTIAAPLRLSAAETVALVAALRALSAQPGLADTAAIDRALAKLEASAGSTVEAAERVAVAAAPADENPPELAGVTGTVREALTTGRRLRLDYWVPARDERTTRDVDPIRLRSAGGAMYLIGWCRRVDDLRTFRLDRVLSAEVLDVPAEVPAAAADAGGGPDAVSPLFTPAPTDQLIRLQVSAAGRWITDYYPVESVEERPDGSAVVALRARDEQWVRRLALSLAGEGELLEPPELVAAVRAAARAALAAYDETPPAPSA